MSKVYCVKYDCRKWKHCRLKYRIDGKWCEELYLKGEIRVNIKLISLTLRFFKGLKEYTLQIDGNNANVYGENGTGKTTLFDAFKWLTFDKDSSNRKDFGIKTLDSSGNEMHGLEHEVEGILSIDGVPTKFKKQFSEKWTKKRGEAEETFTGHETSYWIDDVPVKKNEYTTRINAIIDEAVFKLITDPFYFNTVLSKEERRNIIMKIAGDVSDDEVISSNEKLAKLKTILNGKSMDDYKKILHEQIKKLNDEIQKIPVRIDELHKTMPAAEDDYASIEEELSVLKIRLAEVESSITDASNRANEFLKKQQDLYKLKNQLEAIKKKIDNDATVDYRNLIHEQSQLNSEKYRIETNIETVKLQIQKKSNEATTNAQSLDRLRNEWRNINAEIFQAPDGDNFVCPTCGQPLPEEQKDTKIAELKANYEANKNSRLESNVADGKALKARNEVLRIDIEKLESSVETDSQKLKEIDARITEITQLVNKPTEAPAYINDTEYAEVNAKINALQTELEHPVDSDTTALRAQKSELSLRIEELNKKLNNRAIAENTKARIDELMKQEKDLAKKISELEGHRFLIEQFIKSKVNMLEEHINSKFKCVRFKMFDVQINGGVVECCETLINTNGSWVPWADANHAGKTNAGIDIINTLCKHYGVSAPIFIDFRESVSKIIDTESQVINLIKSEPDKKLRVEVA
jgi:exonuclease SbcC